MYICFFLKVKVGDIMDEVKEFLVLEEEEEVRLDIYLAEQLGDMSRSYIQNYKRWKSKG